MIITPYDNDDNAMQKKLNEKVNQKAHFQIKSIISKHLIRFSFSFSVFSFVLFKCEKVGIWKIMQLITFK